MKETYDEVKEVKVNKHLLRRLLEYAKPYKKHLAFAFVLLIGVIAIELIRPIIIGEAVDGIINHYNQVYSVTSNTEEGIKVGPYWIARGNQGKKKATIVYDESKTSPYYLAIGLEEEEIEVLGESVAIIEEATESYMVLGERRVEVLPLDNQQLSALRARDIASLTDTAILFIIVLVGGVLLSYFQTLLLNYTGQKIIYNIRNDVFLHVEKLSLKFFGEQPIGKLVTRVTYDTETLNEMYTSVIANSVKSIVMLIGISGMMLLLNAKLTAYVFLVIPPVIIMTLWFRAKSRKVYREVRTKIARINSFLSEHISGMKLVQIFGQEQRKYDEFEAINYDLNQSHMKQLKIFSIYRPSMYLLYVFGLFLVLLFGSKAVLDEAISIGTLLIFVQYISSFFDPIQQLAEQYNIVQSAMASSEKIFNLMDEKVEIVDAKDAVELEEVKGVIEFKNVWFAYQEEEWVLKDVSFKVEAGEVAAFVGATGAGKTSILNLIMRYYDIQKGEILIDGLDIRKIQKESLRAKMGQMLQDVFLFTGSIKSNIQLKNEEMTDDEIERAANYVNADAFVRRLPHGYDEKVYEGGATYSAGQRQLLSFARTLAFKPSVLILDEATANIDTETEALIQDALYKLMEGRTTLVVAHRLSTIQHADKIIVMHKGRVKEIGNHQELLGQKGFYYRLYQLQYE